MAADIEDSDEVSSDVDDNPRIPYDFSSHEGKTGKINPLFRGNRST